MDIQQINNAGQITENKYAQLVSSVMTQYDVTLIFYEVKPIKVDANDITKYAPIQEEVARITVSHKTFGELNNLIINQMSQMQQLEKNTKNPNITKKS